MAQLILAQLWTTRPWSASSWDALWKKIIVIKKKTNKQKQKLKYWHQSTSNGMKNNQMKCLASGSNENLDYFVMVTMFNHMVVLLNITEVNFNFCFRWRNSNQNEIPLNINLKSWLDFLSCIQSVITAL